jgi:ribonuclease VapC
MSKVVLDTSAMLTLIRNETGAEVVEGLLGNIVMSCVNISEVGSTLLNSNMSMDEAQEAIEPFVDTIVSFDLEQSMICASLKKNTKHLDLSLGDRACIAPGIKFGVPIYTADKIWKGFKHKNAEIILIR